MKSLVHLAEINYGDFDICFRTDRQNNKRTIHFQSLSGLFSVS